MIRRRCRTLSKHSHLRLRPSVRQYASTSNGGAPDYVRDIVLPDYGVNHVTIAFYTFFRSNRSAVSYRPLHRPGEWIPFECGQIDRALRQQHDDIDQRYLKFLAVRYCVSGPAT
jgi:hypothetical protein